MSSFNERAALTTVCCVFLLTAAACGADVDTDSVETGSAAVMSVADVAPGSADAPQRNGATRRANPGADRVEKRSGANFEQLGAYRDDAPELPRVGNYTFERLVLATTGGAQAFESDAPGDTWIGTLKLDSANEYVLDARHVVDGRFERSVQFAGMYRVAGGYIDFADERGRFLFRMTYELHRATDTLYLRHDPNGGAADEGQIIGVVAKHI